MCVQSVEDGVEGMVDSAEKGTSAVNEAMGDAVEAPASGSSASPEAAPSTETGASAGDASSPGAGTPGDGATEGLGSITALPETGGAPPGALVSSVLLVALGLLVRGVVRR